MQNGEVTELFRILRPKLFKEVIGQPEAVATLTSLLKKNSLPHVLLLSGPSGCGKTSLAHVLKNKLQCSDGYFNDINSANTRGIDSVRWIMEQMRRKPLDGGNQMWVLDECAKLTSDAQTAMLKPLEDMPPWSYFVLCTTDPQKLLPTVRNRATEIKLKPLSRDDLRLVIIRGMKQANIALDDELWEALLDAAAGSARKALVLLQKISGLEPEQQLAELQSPDATTKAIDLCRILIDPNSKSKWPAVAKVIQGLEGEDVEMVRQSILGYANKVLLGSNERSHFRAFLMLEAFKFPFFDSGFPGLAAACFSVFHGK